MVLRERGTKRRKLVTCADVTCPKGQVPGPESLEDVDAPIRSTLQAGAVGCGDGRQAIKSAVGRSADGKVPLAYAIHGITAGKKQFTAF